MESAAAAAAAADAAAAAAATGGDVVAPQSEVLLVNNLVTCSTCPAAFHANCYELNTGEEVRNGQHQHGHSRSAVGVTQASGRKPDTLDTLDALVL
jgi:hypothetical protein